MANLPETPDYPAGVYQLETSDPVLGGPGGIANRQAEQLGNRTAWLKAKIDAFLDGTVAVLKATKLATARSLSFSGAASGSAPFDGSADANIVLTLADSGAVAGTYPKVTINAKGLVTAGAALVAGDIPSLDWSKINSGKPTTLGGYGITDGAPLASPAFTGNPSAPTPAQFDADTSLATTEFVQRALGSLAGATAVDGTLTLDASYVGKLIRLGNSGYTVTLPALAALPVGACIRLRHTGTAGQITVAANGSDTMSTTGNNLSSIVLSGAGASLSLIKQTASQWSVVDGSAQLGSAPEFGASLTASGSQKLPSGKIEQWIIDTSAFSAGVERVLTLPITFPIGILAAAAMAPSSSSGAVLTGRWISNSQIGITSSQNIAAGAGVSVIIYGR